MSAKEDTFTGTWRFSPKLSQLSSPAPRSWIQQITVRHEEIFLTEHITRSDETQLIQRVAARFDSLDYPVEGSPIIDTIAYTRVNPNKVSGTGKKNGIACFTETVLLHPGHEAFSLSYSYQVEGRTVAHGVAVFQLELQPSAA